MGKPPSSKSENELMDTQKSQVKKEQKPTKAKIENESALELKDTMPKSEALPQMSNTKEKMYVSDVLDKFNEETSENEKMEILGKIPLDEIQEYIERQNCGSLLLIKQLFLLPIKMLSQLNAYKFTDEQVYGLCFGKTKDNMQSRHPHKETIGKAQRQARFEMLIGNDVDLLKRFDTPIMSPFLSGPQLFHIRSLFEGDFKPRYCTLDKLQNFFPHYELGTESLVDNEKERFAKFFNPADVQSMLEKEGALEFSAWFR